MTAHVPGDDLHERFAGLDAPTQRELAGAFGRYLAEIHDAFEFEGYGRLVADGDSLTAPGDEEWIDWFVSYGRRAVEDLPAAFDSLRSDLRGLFDDPKVDPSLPARLYPWDFRPGNALFESEEGELAALLDWERPLSAAPALSVAKAEYLVVDWYVPRAETEALRRAFRAGYEQRRPYPDPRPAHRAAAIAESAVDSTGAVTNPRYPELDREAAVAFHRRALEELL